MQYIVRAVKRIHWPEEISIFGEKYKHIHHQKLDKVVGTVRSRSIPVNFFSDGWGNTNLHPNFKKWINLYEKSSKYEIVNPDSRFNFPRKIDIKFTEATKNKKVRLKKSLNNRVLLLEGTFESPTKIELENILPKASIVGNFLLVLPINNSNDFWNQYYAKMNTKEIDFDSFMEFYNANLNNKKIPISLLLPGTGDQGYNARLHGISLDLAKSGFGSIIYESPYYGQRKPKNQIKSKLNYASDLIVLGRTTIEESASILNYLHVNQYFGNLLIGGVSMGALHSAMTTSLLSFEIGCLAYLAPSSASPVFSTGLLSSVINWKLLEKEAIEINLKEKMHQFKSFASTEYTPTNDKYEDSRKLMHQFFSITDINNFAVPLNAEKSIICVARNDLYVPNNSWNEMVQNKWRGAELITLNGGHVSESTFRIHRLSALLQKLEKRM